MDRSTTRHDSATERIYRIATRESPLAMWQAEYVATQLSKHGIETQIVPLVSRGDVDMRPIDGTRQVGLFTKRIQQALLDDEGDIAVHSLKDLPTEANDSLALAAVSDREIVNDSLVSTQGWTIDELPEGARIGTGSRRRAAQLMIARSDLQILPIRGNVQTRLKKLADGEYEAIVLAEAGLLRLEMADVKRTEFPLDQMLPAPGQGALGIEVRSNDPSAREIVGRLDHAMTRAAVTAERTLLASLHGGCLAPIAAYAVVIGDALQMKAIVASTDGKQRLTAEGSMLYDAEAALHCGAKLGEDVAEKLIQVGARELIEQSR